MELIGKKNQTESNSTQTTPSYNNYYQSQEMPTDPYGGQYNQYPPQGDPYAQYPDSGYGQYQQPYPVQDDIRERVEEIAEAIIEEKWNELIKDINKVIEWKERTDAEIKKIQQEIIHLKERFESLHQGVLGKVSEYDKNLINVGTEIKAMEMAFQKILPTFAESINKLERITKNAEISTMQRQPQVRTQK